MMLVHKRFIKIWLAAVKISREENRKQAILPELPEKLGENVMKSWSVDTKWVKMTAARLVGW